MIKTSKDQVLDILGYAESPNYRSTSEQYHPLTAHLFRAAGQAGAEGCYLFRTSPDDEVLPPRPAVYIAEANTQEDAREIHRSLWNLGNAPFLIVILPGQIRVYTGFEYDQQNKDKGLIILIDGLNLLSLKDSLADYHADAIDSGRLWASQSKYLKPETRLDSHLLKTLKKVEAQLFENGLDRNHPLAHALIGKYVYIRYLKDRNVISPEWLEENEIDIELVLGRNATLKGLRKLIETIDERFNGHIFPLPLSGKSAPTDGQIKIVASAFQGDDPISGQLSLFDPYNFFYIPVETLSAIYEQFLRAQGKGKKVGAVYTPEHLADYLLAELNYVKPLEKGMKVLDPCCGSGIFLVLAYRKLIESELSKRPDQKLRPTELREILTESIFGVERNAEACCVTELSLILTMLHYISPPELHRNKQFQFPVLHNRQIFEADFFDDSSEFWQQDKRFDWVIGNPPWIEPEKTDKEEQHVISWINNAENRRERPVAGNRVSEAFSWRVTDLLKDDGCTGLVLHATSLFNHESKKYRQEFFKQHEVQRMTNFTNLRYVLFGGRGIAPAVTVTYCKALPERDRQRIIHYGPFVINQALSKVWEATERKETWALTINENEVCTVLAEEAKAGEAVTWKLALWGTYRDSRALQRLRRQFTLSLGEFRKARGWHLHEGVRLMKAPISGELSKYKLIPAPELKGQNAFSAAAMVKSGRRFSVPEQAFQRIPEELCFIRERSGQASLKETGSVHLVIHAAYSVFSDQSFVLQAPDKRLSAPLKDADELRALSVFFSSSLVRYFLFFHSPAWGIERDRIYKRDIEQIPIPSFTADQIADLAALHKELAEKEADPARNAMKLQEILDEGIERTLNIPKSISTLARDFVRVRLSLISGRVTGIANQPPMQNDLLGYGQLLRDELDQFTKGRVRHKVSFINAPNQEMLVCEVEVTNAAEPLEVSIVDTNGHLKTSLNKLNRKLREQFSQWVYVQRGLRIFDGSKVYICKSPRLIDWTKTQALNDSDDLIAEVLSRRNSDREVAANGVG